MEPITQDTITGLAQAEACRIRKFRDRADEEQDRADLGLPAVPLLHVGGGRSGRWTVRSSGAEGHPNEPRMAFVEAWVDRTLNETRGQGSEGDPSGTYRLELHDSCTYLPRAEEYRDVLCFCRETTRKCSRIATFPDPFQAAGFGHEDGRGPRDPVSWDVKTPTVVFAGSSTGDTDPSKNARILACLWALGHPRETDFRISAVVQMCPYDLIWRNPRVGAVLAPHLPPLAQFRHRFILNIVGNTACWSRVPMVMGSRSVLFHMPHSDAAWYYPEMKAGQHYIECTGHEQILESRRALATDDRTCQRITFAANLFHDQYLTSLAASTYARHLIFSIPGK